MNALAYQAPRQMPLCRLDTPVPAPNEVLVSVKAVGICGSDVHGFIGLTGRRKPPLVMGHEFSGVISAVGSDVTTARIGDRVVVHPLLTCGECAHCRGGRSHICLYRGGIGLNQNGAFADYVCVPEKNIYRLPDSMSFAQGALVEPLAVALHGVNLTPFDPTDTVVIFGGGTIGLFTLLAVRMRGAGKIILTDPNAPRRALAREWGADVTLNPNETDVVESIRKETGGFGAPAILEVVGSPITARQSILAARPGANISWIGSAVPDVEISMQTMIARELTLRGTYAYNQEFADAIDLICTGRADPTPLIECIAPLVDGTAIMSDLADKKLRALKVILEPGTR